MCQYYTQWTGREQSGGTDVGVPKIETSSDI